VNTRKVWNEFLSIIKANTTDISYETWFTPLYVKNIDEDVNTIYLASKEEFVLSFLQDRYMKLIEDAFETVLKKKFKVVIKYENDYLDVIKTNIEETGKRLPEDQSKLFNPRFTFSNFVVANNNKIAHAASLAVAESPGSFANPLFIWGASGLGKTHLMQAIGIYIIQNNPSSKVLYVTAEMFGNDMIASLAENKMRAFKNKYRKVDVLLIDDIQFLEGKKSMQEEFFYTFEALIAAHKQIVINSDRHPNNLVDLEDRLRTRFKSHLMPDIQPADFETRVAILKKKAENAGLEWTNEIFDSCSLIAEQISDSIKELEGAFNNVIGFSNLLGEPIDVAFTKRILKDILVDSDKAIAPERIRSLVAKYYKVKVSDIDSQKRNAELTLPRQVAMFLCRENTDLSHQKIGNLFGRHYSTVIHSSDKIAELEKKDDNIKKDLAELRKRLKDTK